MKFPPLAVVGLAFLAFRDPCYDPGKVRCADGQSDPACNVTGEGEPIPAHCCAANGGPAPDQPQAVEGDESGL